MQRAAITTERRAAIIATADRHLNQQQPNPTRLQAAESLPTAAKLERPVPPRFVRVIRAMAATSIATAMVSAASRGAVVTDQVSVDAHFARFGSKSYAINKINSVDIRVARPHGEGAIWVWGLLSLFCVLTFIGSMSSPQGLSVGSLMLAAIFGFLAYRAWLKSKIKEYQLFLMTSSSEAQAYVTSDLAEVSRLRERIEKAMAAS